MSFGRTIRGLRKERGITQKELAEGVGIDFTYLSKIENDRMPPPSEKTIRALGEALGTDPDQLILLAGKLPVDLVESVAEGFVRHPEAIRYFRSSQGDIKTRQDWLQRLSRKEKGAD